MDFDPLNMTREETRQWSSQMVDYLSDVDGPGRKQAALSMTDYLRPTNREASFVSKFLTPGGFDETERHRSTDFEGPQIMIDIEPDSAGAEVVDFGSMAETFTPFGKRVIMRFQQVQTQRIVKNVIELEDYRYNFRTVLTDLLSLRLAFLRDARFIRATQKCLSPTGTPLAYTGKVNNAAISTPWGYHTWQRFQNLMREQPNAIEPTGCLFSHGMIALMKSQLVIEFPGTQVATDIFRSGMTELRMEGDNVKMVATNKTTLVPKGTFYLYGAENRLGRYVQYKEPTMLVENRGLRVSMELYEILGIALINQAAIAGSTFTTV